MRWFGVYTRKGALLNVIDMLPSRVRVCPSPLDAAMAVSETR